jgi:hypothetical protein
MKRVLLTGITVLLCLSVFSIFAEEGFSFSKMRRIVKVQKITKEELKSVLDDPEITIIDVRMQRDWKSSDQKINGAVHEDPLEEEASWAVKYSKDRNIVLY